MFNIVNKIKINMLIQYTRKYINSLTYYNLNGGT